MTKGTVLLMFLAIFIHIVETELDHPHAHAESPARGTDFQFDTAAASNAAIPEAIGHPMLFQDVPQKAWWSLNQ